MEVLLSALITTLFIFGPAGLAFAYAHLKVQKVRKELQVRIDAQSSDHRLLTVDIQDLNKHLAHAISEIQILKGAVMENDDLIDNLFEREKLMVQELEDIKKPKKMIKKSIKASKLSSKLKMDSDRAAKNMVFHLSNTKSSRRSK